MPNQPIQHLILIRGLTRESAHWGEFVPQLQAGFPDAKLVQVDLPGAGPYYQSKAPVSVKGLLEHIRNQAAQQGAFASRPLLIAVSLGGMIAWEWTLRHADEIAGAALMNISLGGISPFYERLDWHCYPELFTALRDRRIDRREAGLLKLLSNRKDNFDQLAANWTAIQKARPVSGKNALRQILAAAFYRPGKVKPHSPILLLNSRGDRLVSPRCSQAISEKWRLPLHTHPWGGHDLSLDAGEWIIQQIKQWSVDLR